MGETAHKVLFIMEVLDKATGKFKKIQRVSETISTAGKKITKTYERVNGVLTKTTTKMSDIAKAAKPSARNFMGLGFSLLFMGMALKRFVGGFLKKAVDSFKIMGNEQSIFNVKTNELAAAWEFFKFSLIDALSQSSLFLTLIDMVIGLVNWLGQLSPRTKVFLVMAAGVTVAVAALASLAGQIGLFMIGVQMAGGASVIFGTITAALGLVKGGLVKAAKAAWAFHLANPFILLAVSALALIIIMALLTKRFGGIAGAAKQLGITVGMIFALIGDLILEVLIMPLRAFIRLINLAIRGLNKLTFSNISEIKLPDPGIITRAAANALVKYEVKPQLTHEQTVNALREDLASAFREIMPEFQKAVEEGNDASSEKNNPKLAAATVEEQEKVGRDFLLANTTIQ